jgi:putative Mn2+ efflux pump MntP
VVEAIALAFALAMDATAVAAACSVSGGVRTRDLVTLCLLFGAFQSGCSAIGWLAGAAAARWMTTWDHWLAFGVLALLGLRMIVNGLRGGEEVEARTLSIGVQLALAVATSIDALAAGVTLPSLPVSAGIAIALIGGITAATSLAGAWLGRLAGDRFGAALEIAGGLALIGVGSRVLYEHLT